jgi:hypothetical protein
MICVSLCLIGGDHQGFRSAPSPGQPVRFQPVHLHVDSGTTPLAAYQIDFRVARGDVSIVGIEGGDHPAFREAPFYDPQAIQHQRVILAAFSTRPTGELPSGRTRVATLHLRIAGDETPAFNVKLQAAANEAGERVQAKVSIEPRNP